MENDLFFRKILMNTSMRKLPSHKNLVIEVNRKIRSMIHNLAITRSSSSVVSLGKGVLKLCSKFIGEHAYRSSWVHLGMGVLLQICCIFSENVAHFQSTSGGLLLYHIVSTELKQKEFQECRMFELTSVITKHRHLFNAYYGIMFF